VVEEYEQEELAEDSDDEKRLRRVESQALKKRKMQSANNQGGKRPRIERLLPLPSFKGKERQHEVNEGRQIFREKLLCFPTARLSFLTCTPELV